MRRGRRSSFVGAPPARSPAGELSKSPDGSAAAVKRKAWEWEAQSVSRTRSLSQQQTDMSEDEEEQEFTEWLNDQLRAGYGTKNAVQNIFTDLRDGTLLARLLKFLERRKFLRYYAATTNDGEAKQTHFPWKQIVERPRLTFHVKQNLTQCFDFIKTYSDIRVFNVGIDDFQQGDRKAVMAVLWALVTFVAKVDAFFQSQFNTDDEDADAGVEIVLSDGEDSRAEEEDRKRRNQARLLKLKQRMAEWDARLVCIRTGLALLQRSVNRADRAAEAAAAEDARMRSERLSGGPTTGPRSSSSTSRRQTIGSNATGADNETESLSSSTNSADAALQASVSELLASCETRFAISPVHDGQIDSFFAHAPPVALAEIEAFFLSKADEVDAFAAQRKEERDTRLRLEAEERARAERAATEKRRLEEEQRRKAEIEAAERRRKIAEAEEQRRQAEAKAAALRKAAEDAAAERRRKRLEEAELARRIRAEAERLRIERLPQTSSSSTQTPKPKPPPPPKPPLSPKAIETAVTLAEAPLRSTLADIQKMMQAALRLGEEAREAQRTAAEERAALASQAALALRVAQESLAAQHTLAENFARHIAEEAACRAERRARENAAHDKEAAQQLAEKTSLLEHLQESAEASQSQLRALVQDQMHSTAAAIRNELQEQRTQTVSEVTASILQQFENSFSPHQVLVDKSHAMLLAGLDKFGRVVDSLGSRIEAVEANINYHGSAVADAAMAAGEAAAAAALVASQPRIDLAAGCDTQTLMLAEPHDHEPLHNSKSSWYSHVVEHVTPLTLVVDSQCHAGLRVELSQAVEQMDAYRVQCSKTGLRLNQNIASDDVAPVGSTLSRHFQQLVATTRRAYLDCALRPVVRRHFQGPDGAAETSNPQSPSSHSVAQTPSPVRADLRYHLRRVQMALAAGTALASSTEKALDEAAASVNSTTGAPSDVWKLHVLPLVGEALSLLPPDIPEYWLQSISRRAWWSQLGPVLVSAFVAVPIGAVPDWLVHIVLERGESWLDSGIRNHVIAALSSGYFDCGEQAVDTHATASTPKPSPPSWVDDIVCPRGICVGSLNLASLIAAGWKVHYFEEYAHATRTNNAVPSAGRYMLVGAVEGSCTGGGVDWLKHSAATLVVAAAGLRKVVTQQTFSQEEAKFHHGAYWYFYRGGSNSFGFSPTAKVQLSSADSFDPTSPERLSWHIDHGIGGWRAGTRLHLDSSKTIRKVVLTFL